MGVSHLQHRGLQIARVQLVGSIQVSQHRVGVAIRQGFARPHHKLLLSPRTTTPHAARGMHCRWASSRLAADTLHGMRTFAARSCMELMPRGASKGLDARGEGATAGVKRVSALPTDNTTYQELAGSRF